MCRACVTGNCLHGATTAYNSTNRAIRLSSLRNFTEFCQSRFSHTPTTYGSYGWLQLSFNFHPAAFLFQKTHRLVKKSTNFIHLPYRINPHLCFCPVRTGKCDHRGRKNNFRTFNAVCLLIFRCRSVILYYEKNSKKIISDSCTYFFDCCVAAWSGVCRQAIWRCVFQSFSGQLLCVRWRSGFTSGRQKNTLAGL